MSGEKSVGSDSNSHGYIIVALGSEWRQWISPSTLEEVSAIVSKGQATHRNEGPAFAFGQ